MFRGNNYASMINKDGNEGEYVFYSDDIERFIEYIAELAISKQSGARSLKTVFDDCISSALFRIFAGEYTNISLVKPDDENNKPYVLTKTKGKKHGLFFVKNKKTLVYY